MMEHSESLKALSEALAKAQGEVENAHKNAKNPHFRSDYADLAEIINTVRPVLNKHGLSVVQMPGFADGVVTMDTMLLHTSGEWLRGVSGSPAQKQDPQGVGSAITYLRRYSLAALCGIAQEDDDGEGAIQRNGKPKAEAAPSATADQITLIETMKQSHVITDKERKDLAGRVARGMTKDEASKAIEWLMAETKGRKAAEKAEQEEGPV